MSSATKCSECQTGFHIFKRKLECGSCSKALCSNCRSERKLCRKCEMLRDENVIRMTLQDLQALGIKDLKVLQAHLNARVPSTVIEKDDLAKCIFQSILQRRQQMEDAERVKQQQRRQQQQGQGPGPAGAETPPRPQQTQPPSGSSSSGGFMGFMEELFGDSNPPQRRQARQGAGQSAANGSNASRPASSQPGHQRASPSNQSQPRQQEPTSNQMPSAQGQARAASGAGNHGANSQRVEDDRLRRQQEQNARRAEAERAVQKEKEAAAVEIHLTDIKTEADLGVLTVRQMKVLLHRNKVDYSMCVEREELHARVVQLWRDDQASKRIMEKGPDNDDDLCKICFDAPLNCVFLECGHLMSCIDCGTILKECPICRNYITRRVHTFKA